MDLHTNEGWLTTDLVGSGLNTKCSWQVLPEHWPSILYVWSAGKIQNTKCSTSPCWNDLRYKRISKAFLRAPCFCLMYTLSSRFYVRVGYTVVCLCIVTKSKNSIHPSRCCNKKIQSMGKKYDGVFSIQVLCLLRCYRLGHSRSQSCSCTPGWEGANTAGFCSGGAGSEPCDQVGFSIFFKL